MSYPYTCTFKPPVKNCHVRVEREVKGSGKCLLALSCRNYCDFFSILLISTSCSQMFLTSKSLDKIPFYSHTFGMSTIRVFFTIYEILEFSKKKSFVNPPSTKHHFDFIYGYIDILTIARKTFSTIYKFRISSPPPSDNRCFKYILIFIFRLVYESILLE